MSDGVFRDASGALERAGVLEEENQALHDELVKLRTQVDLLRGELDVALADTEGPRDVQRELQRLRDERDDLRERVKELSALDKQVRELRADQKQRNERLYDAQTALVNAKLEVEQLERRLALAREESKLPVIEPNGNAYAQRLQEERDELLKEVRELREAKPPTPPWSFMSALFSRRRP